MRKNNQLKIIYFKLLRKYAIQKRELEYYKNLASQLQTALNIREISYRTIISGKELMQENPELFSWAFQDTTGGKKK